jgi:hypothetical protein
MNIIEEVFERMDRWRNLPKYGLERRADIFFGVYLKHALEVKYKVKIQEEIIPEFPVRKATVDPSIQSDQSSFNVDFLAFSEDRKIAFLIELKTDIGSRREKQDYYLQAVKNIGLVGLIHGLVKIFQATKIKRKYFHLFKMLENAGIVELPSQLQSLVFSENMSGVNALIRDVKITAPVGQMKVVYIQPTGEAEQIINFMEFASLIKGIGGPVTQRFVESLKTWSNIKAGDLHV